VPEKKPDEVTFAELILKRCEYCKPGGTGEACTWEACFMASLIIEMAREREAIREAFPEVREWLDKHLAP
jgi:hypothetical protein